MSMKVELKGILEAREKESAELKMMKVKLSDIEKKHNDEMESIKELVINMLEDVPQCESITEQFAALEDSVTQLETNYNSIQSLEIRMKHIEEIASDNTAGNSTH